MGPLDRHAFRVLVSLALYVTLALVAAVAGVALAPHHPLLAGALGLVAAVNGGLGLRLHRRLVNHAERHGAH